MPNTEKLSFEYVAQSVEALLQRFVAENRTLGNWDEEHRTIPAIEVIPVDHTSAVHLPFGR